MGDCPLWNVPIGNSEMGDLLTGEPWIKGRDWFADLLVGFPRLPIPSFPPHDELSSMEFLPLSKKAIEAPPGYSRWLIPPAALAIHLCIGQAYAFSVFRLPMTKILGITKSIEGDWSRTAIFWAFTIAIVFLGLSAAVLGRWVERVGPRVSGLVSAVCWSSGFLISALAIELHNIWLLYFGYGVVGGCGLGIGYITPVSTLIKWFPDRRGLATGLAIMGFGGGAMVASPLSEALMRYFANEESTGVLQTFLVLGALYFVVMTCGALAFRLPSGSEELIAKQDAIHEEGNKADRTYLDPAEAIQTPVFYRLWMVLFLNVTAGIGILDVASPMIQEMFPGRVLAAEAAGFVGLLSLFNLAGRFFWSSASDRLGRKLTYGIFLTLGPVLYFCVPFTGIHGSLPLFVLCLAIALSMYGGGFAAIPAYLSDVFGTRYVSAIHGRLLTAWSCAGIAGPALINFFHEWELHREKSLVSPERAYDKAIWFFAVILLLGFVANLGVKSLVAKPANLPKPGPQSGAIAIPQADIPWLYLIPAWLAVGIPMVWGVAMTIKKTLQLFS